MAIDWNKPVQTKDGRKVRILCRSRICVDSRTVVGLVDCGKTENIHTWRGDGSYCRTISDGMDLTNVPEPRIIPYKRDEWEKLVGTPVREKKTGCVDAVISVNPDRTPANADIYIGSNWFTPEEAMEVFEHLDGTPLGVEETE